ncbi:DUF58 domain-containing protein [Methanocalculus taiwanensis]|uniref:DUF58 domain-containing protein n=1 Tax=Methanocalculus taiwanensis TaxID=106207 RepID=A0ABD4TG88_9EURY|nr:DUF58 domain-containing protein [Methanocalculus taiwanensis]MCQ1537741.1 DUF58 domain-containing protein [Methanocalculus taiwanensis]
MRLSGLSRCPEVLPTPLSRALLAAGLLTIVGGGAMASTPAVVTGSVLLLFLFSRAILFLKAEKQVIATFHLKRHCDNLIVRQYGIITVTLSADLDQPHSSLISIHDMPGPGFEVPDNPVFDVGETSELTYRIQARARGTISFHGATLEMSDRFFSTAIIFTRPEDCMPEVQVQPRGSPVVLNGESLGYGESTSRRLISSSGTMVRSFREYMPGDDPRQIDWKITAKTKRLTIREAYAQAGEIPVVVLDMPLDFTIAEQLIGFAAGAAEDSLKLSHSVSLLAIAGGNVIRFLPDERQASRLLAAIRDLPPTARWNQFYHYLSETDSRRVKLSLPAGSPLHTWYDAVIQNRGIPSFEAECIRAFARTKGTAVLLFSAADGDTSHLGMVARAARRIGLSVHLRIPAHSAVSIRPGAFPIDTIEVI